LAPLGDDENKRYGITGPTSGTVWLFFFRVESEQCTIMGGPDATRNPATFLLFNFNDNQWEDFYQSS